MVREKGIHIRTYIIWIVSATVLSSILLLTSTLIVQKQYEKNTELEIKYHASVENVELLKNSSDNLTRQVQHFVVTGDIEYVQKYFEEKENGGREFFIKNLFEQEIQKSESMDSVITESDYLMDYEYHAMKLVTETGQFGKEDIPDEVLKYSLSEEELGYSEEEKKAEACKLVFGEAYQAHKEKIDSLIIKFTDKLMEDSQKQNNIVRDKMRILIIHQLVFVVVLILVVAVTFWILHTQVVAILLKYVKDITQNRPLERKGVFEFRYLADTYNEVNKRNSTEAKLLKRKAEYDSLTNIINRGTFEHRVIEIMQRQKRENKYAGSFILIDVDNFKNINDAYGHEMGDRLLRKIADRLNRTFRTTDLVSRFGGEEFAVWISELNVNQKDIIVKKIEWINQELLHPDDNMPAVSVSAGAAFMEKGDEFISIYKKADEMLYHVKRNGRCGCAVHSVEEDNAEK